jgi:hypothetical protein
VPIAACEVGHSWSPPSRNRVASAEQTREPAHAGGNLYSAAGNGGAGGQGSGGDQLQLAVRPDHVAGCEGVLVLMKPEPEIWREIAVYFLATVFAYALGIAATVALAPDSAHHRHLLSAEIHGHG